ncbi:MAG: GYD domain-containing protein [Gemmataceae bacterium]
MERSGNRNDTISSKGTDQWQLSSPTSSSRNRASRTSIPLDQAGGDLQGRAKKLGAKVKDIYWTLGDHDRPADPEAPDDETAAAAILHLGAMGNVHIDDRAGLTATEMDKIVAKVHPA